MMNKLKIITKNVAQIKTIPYICINKQRIRNGKDKTIQGRLLRLRLGFMGNRNGQQGSWIWQKQNCST